MLDLIRGLVRPILALSFGWAWIVFEGTEVGRGGTPSKEFLVAGALIIGAYFVERVIEKRNNS